VLLFLHFIAFLHFFQEKALLFYGTIPKKLRRIDKKSAKRQTGFR